MVLLSCHSVQAQRYGQWSWRAAIGLEQGQREFLSDDVLEARSESQGLRVGGVIDGYVLSPVLGSFRLGLDALLTKLVDARFDDSAKLGGQFQLNMFPRGSFPFELYYGQESFDYTLPTEADPFVLANDISGTQSWGGELRLNTGALRGFRLGLKSSITTLVHGEPYENEEQYLSWERSYDRGDRHVWLERESKTYGEIGLEREDLKAEVSERWQLGDSWRWTMNGLVFIHEVAYAGVSTEIGDYRLFSRLGRGLREHDRIAVDAEFNLTDDGRDGVVTRASLKASYSWRIRPSLHMIPFVGYAQQSNDHDSLSSPRAGLTLRWRTVTGPLESIMVTRASIGRQSSSSGVFDKQTLSGLVLGTLRHGGNSSWVKDLHLELSHNELEDRSSQSNEPDEPLLPRSFGGQDRARMRSGLRRRGRISSEIWVEWERIEADQSDVFGGGFATDSVSASGQFRGSRTTASIGTGSAKASQDNGEKVSSTFVVASTSLRLFRSLNLKAHYRLDEQEGLLTPDLDRTTVDLRLDMRVRRLAVELRVFEIAHQVAGGSLSRNQGFSWSIQRRFGGSLPIGGEDERRGVIR